jgi:S-adenosylmethionine uptake transporter
VCTVLVGFAGVACVLQPAIERDQLWGGLAGLLSGVLAALAYLQVTALGRAGEPDYRVVFYFSAGGVIAGALTTPLTGGLHAHSPHGLLLLAAVGVLATVAQLSMTRAYRIGRPLANASLQYLGIGWSFLFGVLWFEDHVTVLALVGMTLIVAAGIAAARLRHAVNPAEVASSTLET